MRLSEYTDYTLRVLMYCAAHRQRLVTIGELAEHHGLSKNHLMKVVNDLARQGLIETTRGRGGGLRLLKAPETIRIGDVVRASETDFRLVECFDASTNACTLTPSCRLKHLFDAALQAYFKELDGATLADMIGPGTPRAAARRAGAVGAQAGGADRRVAPEANSRASQGGRAARLMRTGGRHEPQPSPATRAPASASRCRWRCWRPVTCACRASARPCVRLVPHLAAHGADPQAREAAVP